MAARNPTLRRVFAPYHVFIRNGLKIGVIGSIGNEAWESIDRKIRAPMTHQNQIEAVRATARRIRSHVDLVVLLSHAGFEFDEQTAAAVAEIDLLIGGHTHVELAQPKLVANTAESGTDSRYTARSTSRSAAVICCIGLV